MAFFRKKYNQFKKKWVGRRKGAERTAKRLVGQVAKTVAMRYLNTELKYHETVHNGALPVAGTALTTLLNGVPLGDYPYNRSGASIKIKSIQGRIDLKQSSTTAYTQGERVRMVVFIDKEPMVSGLGNDPTYTDLYTSGGVRSLRAWESIQQQRFTVLMDRTFNFEPERTIKTFSIYKKLNLVTKFQTTSSAADVVTNNALYIMFMGENGALSSAERVTLDASYRVTFVDN